MFEQQVSSVTFVLTLALWSGISEAASLMRKLHPRGSHQLIKRNVPDFVEWGCPDLNCPPVSDDCEMMEVIAFRYEHGECFGCPYCIDLPSDYNDRERRSLTETDAASLADMDVQDMLEAALSETRRRLPRGAEVNAPIVQNELCERVTCPVSPPGRGCSHPGMLDGYLRKSIKCISCPACLDGQRRN